MQALHLKLNVGADVLHRSLTLSFWLLGLLVFLLHFQGLAWPLKLAGIFLLLRWVYLEWKLKSIHQGALILYRNGAAKWGEHIGTWGSKTSINRIYGTVQVDFQTDVIVSNGIQTRLARKTFLVSASNNDKDDYRCLLVWCRHLPFNITQNTNGFTSA